LAGCTRVVSPSALTTLIGRRGLVFRKITCTSARASGTITTRAATLRNEMVWAAADPLTARAAAARRPPHTLPIASSPASVRRGR
jgi:hypothetical protein